MSPDELETLMIRVLDGTATLDESVRLAGELKSNAAARRQYHNHSSLVAAMAIMDGMPLDSLLPLEARSHLVSRQPGRPTEVYTPVRAHVAATPASRDLQAVATHAVKSHIGSGPNWQRWYEVLAIIAVCGVFAIGYLDVKRQLAGAKSDQAKLQAIVERSLAQSNAHSPGAGRSQLEDVENRELLTTFMTNWGNSTEESRRLVSNAYKIHRLEVDRYIPSMYASGIELEWFEYVIRDVATSLSLGGDTPLVPLNGQPYPSGAGDEARLERVEYFYGVWAESTLRRVLRATQHADIDEPAKNALVELIRLDRGAHWPAEFQQRIPDGRNYVVVQVEVSADNPSEGDVVFYVIDPKAKSIEVKRRSFSNSLPPKSVREKFGNPDHKSSDDIDVKRGAGDEFVVSFPASFDTEAPQVSLLTFDPKGMHVSRDELGDGLAYVCFETKVVSDGSSTPDISFATGGEGAVTKAAIPARTYGSGWERVRIPIQATIGESWRTGLTITITGGTNGAPVRVHIRNAYIQPVGGKGSNPASVT